jgi:hypothetical protein
MAARVAILSRLMPAAANAKGNKPQAMPSFKLFTRPALTDAGERAIEERRAPENVTRREGLG